MQKIFWIFYLLKLFSQVLKRKMNKIKRKIIEPLLIFVLTYFPRMIWKD